MSRARRCDHCGKAVRGHVPRQYCRHLYCGRRCFGLARRAPKHERVARKQAYDRARRIALAAEIKAQKADYFRRTYDPVKAAQERKKTMARHVAYCRRPEYRAQKAAYDRAARAKEYGPFADAYGVLLELQREVVRQMPDKYERAKARGYYLRTAQQRRRAMWLKLAWN